MADWFRLDNAALIFPAVRRRDWTNAFRVSATLNETVQPEILQRAVDMLLPRFPLFMYACARACSGIICSGSPARRRSGAKAPAP